MNLDGYGDKMAATLKNAQEKKIAPWDDIDQERDRYFIFNDRYAVTPGHKLFVPKVNNAEEINYCFLRAAEYGEWLVLKGDANGYNLGINAGQAAGQTVMYPHIHMIPRRDGDCEDPVGGVRNVIPGRGNYKKWS
jgi:diadenosine tetraphosphate (Ap4A) HIT family hydrolase